MNEKKARWSVVIAPVKLSEEEEEKLIEVRTIDTHYLLAKLCEQGILLFDSKSRSQYLLTWEDMKSPKSK